MNRKCIYLSCQNEAKESRSACCVQHWAYHKAITEGEVKVNDDHLYLTNKDASGIYIWPVFYEDLLNLPVPDVRVYQTKL